MIRYVVIALLASGCGGAVLRPLVPTDAARDLEQVTRTASDERSPAISPDGKALAFEVDGSHVDVVSSSIPVASSTHRSADASPRGCRTRNRSST